MADTACHVLHAPLRRGLTQALGRMFKVAAVVVFLSSILGVLLAGSLVSAVLALYPVTHLGSFGPVVPAISQTHAAWLPAVQMVTWAIAAASAAAGVLLWRGRPAAGKLQAALLIGALNYFLALFFTTALLITYFYLPKVANAA